MTSKTILAALAAALAFAALPGVAAADPVVDLPENRHFTVSGGNTALSTSGGKTVTCTSVGGTGEFDAEDSNTGSIQFLFHGCKETSFGLSCKSPEKESGTIETTELTFHVTTITNGTPAVLITPNNPDANGVGHVMTANCSFLAHTEVTGTGLIGEITEEYDKELSTWDIDFASTEHGQQAHTTIDNDNTDYDLHTSVNGGAAETQAIDAETTLHFTEGQGKLTEG